MPTNSISLNGFKVELSAPTVKAYVQDVMESRELKDLREKFKDTWFLYWRDGTVYALPRTPHPRQPFGTPQELQCSDHLWFIAARIADVLPEKFPAYAAFRRRPFTFLGRKEELVQLISENVNGLHPLTKYFKIRPKFELDAKLVELREGDLFIGLFMEVGTRWDIMAPLTELAGAGIDLRGLFVVRRKALPGQRRLVGRVSELTGGNVELLESYDELTSVGADDVWLEGSRASFARCLKSLLGGKYAAFEEERHRQEANIFTGPALVSLLNRMNGFLRQASPISLGEGLTCSIAEQIKVENSRDYKSVYNAPAVWYCFDSAKTKRTQLPWPGIVEYKPFSRDSFPKKSPKILVLFPDTVQGKVENFLRQFRDGVNIRPRSHYSGGFAPTFGLVNTQFILRRIPWLGNGKRAPAQAYREAAEEFLSEGGESIDAAIVVILDEHSGLPDAENPYLRSKAVLLMAGVPVQEIRTATLGQQPGSMQYTLQNLSIALYAKMNGTPWTVDHDLTINDELVIGMGMCELSNSRFHSRQRYIGITTVFRGDGNYLLGSLSRECSYDEYPDVLKESTLGILREIKERNGWRPDDSVRAVFHVYKPLRHVEMADIMAECVKTVGSAQNTEFAFLTVSHDHPFTVLDTSQLGIAGRYDPERKKAVYVPERGTIVQLGKYTKLLCATGPRLVKLENAPLPHPLLVHLHPHSTFRSLDYLTEQVLKFTSLSWRSTHPARKPVTIYYSELIADQLARLRNVPDWSPAMLNVKLRASRWFL
jgi:hypothetical protein